MKAKRWNWAIRIVLKKHPATWAAYRAYRWFRFVRKYKVFKKFRIIRQLRKLKKELEMGKAIWQSKTMWGLVLMGYGFIAQQFGFPLVDTTEATNVLVEFAAWVIEAAGAVMVFWGRMTATVKISGLIKG